jgi:hypothetical protein
MKLTSFRPYARPLALLSLGLPLAALAADQASTSASLNQQKHDMRPLIEKVFNANRKFANINTILGKYSPWVQATQCVSGPEFGAMGVHYIVPDRVFVDPKVYAEEPEALIYEPRGNNQWELVGVEFIVLKSLWEAQTGDDKPTGPPTVDGHQMNYVGFPNRYGLPEFYELHVWAFEQNPVGSFADWNTRVSCDKQPDPDPHH